MSEHKQFRFLQSPRMNLSEESPKPNKTGPLPLSVVIASVRGWRASLPAIELIAPQVAKVGAEIVVADGSGAAAPTEAELAGMGCQVHWLPLPGKSVFQLRRAAYRASRGDVVAVTEDHCFVATDWVERILAAHARYPDAGAIGGAVANGTNTKLVDWAAFFLTQGPYMAPLVNGPAQRISGAANVSYKRRVLDRIAGDDEYGLIEFLELGAALQNEILANDDSILALHHQSQGFWRTSLAEFDNGRTIAGYRRRQMKRGDWLRIAGSPVLPIYRSVRALRIVRRKDRPSGVLAKSVPAHVWLQYCAMAGELLGYLGGPGGSPRRLY